MCSKGKGLTYRKIKTLIEDHPTVVYDSLLGNATTNKNVAVLKDYQIIMRRDHGSMRGKVKIISGGGAGVEPAEAYCIGQGMLTAAVLGEMFTAPSAEAVLVAIRELAFDHSDGILLLIKNYLGDKLNFGLALDRALSEDINVKMLTIGDNVTEFEGEKQGRKGLAGSILVYKIAGEMAEQGKSLDEIVEELNENILTDIYTVGVTLTVCQNPISDPIVSFIEANEIALGMGIYGQRGSKKLQIGKLKDVVNMALEEIHSFTKTNNTLSYSNVVLLINNLGGTSKFEESLVSLEAHKLLSEWGIKVHATYVGTFMSCLNTQGFSITLLKLNDPSTFKYLNAPTLALAWPQSPIPFDVRNNNEMSTNIASLTVQPICNHNQLNAARYEGMSLGPAFPEKASVAAKKIALFAAEALISCERQLNIIDAEAGDGDTGTVLRRGAEALKKALLSDELNLTYPGKFLFEISDICCKYMGGLSGALYSVFFNAAAKVCIKCDKISPELCAKAFKCGVKALQHYGKAELGDRTILDALWPAMESFETAVMNGKDISQAAYSAATTCELKAEETKYLKVRWFPNGENMYADAGAHAATIWLRAISEGLKLHYPTDSFDEETPYQRPGVFLWKFLTKEEIDSVEDASTPNKFLKLLEKKLGDNEPLLLTLLNETYKFSRKKCHNDSRRISALLGIVYYTHLYFVSSRWRTPDEVYSYFRESILRHCVESPPMSFEIFHYTEVNEIIEFFIESYIRNLPLVRINHLPHYKLRLKLRNDDVSYE